MTVVVLVIFPGLRWYLDGLEALQEEEDLGDLHRKSSESMRESHYFD